ncbi:recombinase family protein [Fontibacillus sp. BL9]|uniref:recombinase family protein n=1 Tax=Fontibacillus sp. BL9 TaxID=3389971 RepID=UPI0039786705
MESGRGEDSVLKINHIEAELVRKIFRMYGSGQGLRSIANQLNAEGYKTKPGNAFSSVAVKTIINNPIYIGKIRYNVRENWNEKRRKGTNKDPIVVDSEHEPIISTELWEAVQKFYKKKAVSAPRKFDGIYLLTGLMRCPQCGATLVAHRVNDTLKNGEKVVRRYYIRSNFRNKGSRVCNSNSVKADFAESYVIQRIAGVVQTPKLLDDIVVSLNKSRSKSVAPLQKELAAIEHGLKTLDSQKQRYFSLYESDTIDNDMLVERINELKSKYDVLANRKSEAERQLDENQAEPIPLQLVRKTLSDFNGLLQTSPVETQKTLIQTIVKQIAVQQGQKLRGIELKFDETLRQCLVVAAPSTDKVDGAFPLSRRKYPSPFTIVI